MEENKELEVLSQEEAVEETVETEVLATQEDSETPLDKNIKLMSPTRMILRRFFRSKLSVAGLIMLASLFLFCCSFSEYQRRGESRKPSFLRKRSASLRASRKDRSGRR